MELWHEHINAGHHSNFLEKEYFLPELPHLGLGLIFMHLTSRSLMTSLVFSREPIGKVLDPLAFCGLADVGSRCKRPVSILGFSYLRWSSAA